MEPSEEEWNIWVVEKGLYWEWRWQDDTPTHERRYTHWYKDESLVNINKGYNSWYLNSSCPNVIRIKKVNEVTINF